MTVDENLLMGIYCRPDKQDAISDVKRMLARFPILEQRRHRLASLLSGGEQQLLAIARACLNPGCCCWTSLRWDWREK
jgi:branched-chain amino acid transport system ATP-binding protein